MGEKSIVYEWTTEKVDELAKNVSWTHAHARNEFSTGIPTHSHVPTYEHGEHEDDEVNDDDDGFLFQFSLVSDRGRAWERASENLREHIDR